MCGDRVEAEYSGEAKASIISLVEVWVELVMYAIIEDSGSQRKVVQGDEILVDLVNQGLAAVGEAISFDKVLVIGSIGGDAKLGLPYVAGAVVKGEIIEPMVLGEKLFVQKFREKKTWKKRVGHRQRFTKVKVTSIAG